jgi:hypothetical protein
LPTFLDKTRATLKTTHPTILLLLRAYLLPRNLSTEPLPSNDKGNFNEPLPSNDKGIFTEPLPSNNKGTFTEPLPNNDGGEIQRHSHTHTHTQRDLIGLLLFFQNKESRLKGN